MYTLTLTLGERQAFDWNGYRYHSSGDRVASLLQGVYDGPIDWEDDADIKYNVP